MCSNLKERKIAGSFDLSFKHNSLRRPPHQCQRRLRPGCVFSYEFNFQHLSFSITNDCCSTFWFGFYFLNRKICIGFFPGQNLMHTARYITPLTERANCFRQLPRPVVGCTLVMIGMSLSPRMINTCLFLACPALFEVRMTLSLFHNISIHLKYSRTNMVIQKRLVVIEIKTFGRPLTLRLFSSRGHSTSCVDHKRSFIVSSDEQHNEAKPTLRAIQGLYRGCRCGGRRRCRLAYGTTSTCCTTCTSAGRGGHKPHLATAQHNAKQKAEPHLHPAHHVVDEDTYLHTADTHTYGG